MTITFTREHYQEAADLIGSRIQIRPQIALILGSGLGELADAVEDPAVIPYSEVPHWPRPTVVGHGGRLVIGQLEGKPVMVMQGRIHYYEGYSMAQVTFPIRVMQIMGIGSLIVTNAAGGLNPEFRAGDIMLITDQINLVGVGGANPLRGPNDDAFGPRFPEMTRAYDRELMGIARAVAADEGIELREGVYICLAGPTFETPAEVRMLRILGGDAVGMSTVPEVIVARHGGMRVLGFSGISNIAIDDPERQGRPTHEEVLEAGKVIVPKLTRLIKGVLRRWPDE